MQRRLIGLTVSGLTVGPKGLMTVCGSVGGVSVDPTTGQLGANIPEGADADEVWYDPGSNKYCFSCPGANDGVTVVRHREVRCEDSGPEPLRCRELPE